MTTNLWRKFEQTLSSRRSKIAFQGSFGAWSFDEVHRRAIAYSAGIAKHPLRSGDRVLILCENHPETASAMLACWMRALIPALVSPDEPERRMDYIVHLVTPRIAIGSLESVEKCSSSIGDMETLVWGSLESHFTGLVSHRALPTDPASIVFTSGSSGPPKAVVQSHGALIRACQTVYQYLRYQEDDSLLGAIPWTFDYGFGQLLTTLLTGLRQIIPNEISPIGAANAIQEFRPSILPLIPSLANYLCRGLVTFRDIDVSSIRLITNTGGRLATPVLEEMFGVFPEDSSQIVLNYGLTESYRTSYLDPELTRKHSDSIGKGIPGVQAIVLRDDGSLCDVDEVGEIVHRGDFLFLGYWGDRTSTAKALRPDPLLPASLHFRPKVLFTGDLGSLASTGLLYHHGRKDAQLKSMGVRVSPGEIEDILCSYPNTSEAAVVGVEDEMLGTRICAAVSFSIGGSLKELRRDSSQKMTRYMTPRSWLELPELPKTQNGKIDYQNIAALFNPSPGTGQQPTDDST